MSVAAVNRPTVNYNTQINFRLSPDQVQSISIRQSYQPAGDSYRSNCQTGNLPTQTFTFDLTGGGRSAAPAQPQRVGNEEYFLGGELITPGPSAPAYPTHPHPISEVISPAPQQPNGPSARKSFAQKFGEGANQYIDGQVTMIKGTGNVVAGTAKTVIVAPLGALEVLGRGAIALTGGKVTYENKSPLQHMGDGVRQAGNGLVTVAEGGLQTMAGAGKMVAYAPLATLELTARGTGMVVGATVAVGYWAGNQVAKSFVGQEFMAGFRTMIPAGAKP